MDIFTFLSTVSSDQGLSAPQLRSFNHYFTTAFTHRFGLLTESKLIRFSVLNFILQQLTVRAIHHPTQNQLLFAGNSTDFAATLVGATPRLNATWCPPGGDSDEDTLTRVLNLGAEDDLKAYSVSKNPFTSSISTFAPCSLGALIVTANASYSGLIIKDVLERLAAGGVIAIEGAGKSPPPLPPDHFAATFTEKDLKFAFSGGLWLVRKDHEL